MKKLICALCAFVLALVCAPCPLCGCTGSGGEYEIAFISDVGQLDDASFNHASYVGVAEYAEENGKTYASYTPAGGNGATANDKINAMRKAIKNGAKVIVAPGYLQAQAIETVAAENPTVKFLFIDGWALPDGSGGHLKNVAAVSYREEEAGFFAGYCAVKNGYNSLGFTGGGAGTVVSVNKYGYGFLQGANYAAVENGLADGAIKVKYSFRYGDTFSPSDELEKQIKGWYEEGTEIVFACGGAMIESVIKAASGTQNGKVIGVDVDQSPLSSRVIMSAVKGLSEAVRYGLNRAYDGNWADIGAKEKVLGAAEDATGVVFARTGGKQQVKSLTVEAYTTLRNEVKRGAVTVDDVPPISDLVAEGLTKIDVTAYK